MREPPSDKERPDSAGLPSMPNGEASAEAAPQRAGTTPAPAPGRISFRRLMNATGVILEPKFGGPPLPLTAQRMVADVAAGYSTMGNDPVLGAAGEQESGVDQWLMHLTGAPSAFAVNSSAGAILLVLSSLANERKVLVSRGELMEANWVLGLSDIVGKSGARIVEVGTAHKTRMADFERAFEKYSSLAAILRIPTPAVQIEDMTPGPGPSELARLAHAHDIPLIEDVGNGAVVDLSRYGFEHRSTVADSFASGASVVTCSGSLLLTGSQVGLIFGETRWIEPMRRDPLMRAVRLDRLVQAALEATLAVHGDPARAVQEIPALAMLSLAEPLLFERAERLAAELQSRIPGLAARVVPEGSERARGALPTSRLSGPLVELRHERVNGDELDRIARAADPPVLGMLREGRLVLDPRTLNEREIAVVATSFAAAWATASR